MPSPFTQSEVRTAGQVAIAIVLASPLVYVLEPGPATGFSGAYGFASAGLAIMLGILSAKFIDWVAGRDIFIESSGQGA